MTDKKSKPTNIFEVFPFLQSFPFDMYEISIEKDTFFIDDIGVDISSISALNQLDEPEVVSFKYDADGNDIVISFHMDDIEYIKELSDGVKKLDAIREKLDNALEDDELKVKVSAIKAGNKFIDSLSSDFKESEYTFKSVLDNIIKLNGVEMSHKLVQNIIDLKSSINIKKLTVNEVKSINMYMDFQLHHAKIMLGIVIAAKIY